MAIRCISYGKETVLSMDNNNNNYNYITTQFLLNTMLHHVGISWIIETYQQLKYYIDRNNPYWITGGTWYNTYICKKIHGAVFEDYIIDARTERYELMCYIYAHEKQQLSYFDDVSSGGGNVLPSNETKEALVSMSVTFNFIYC